MTAYLLDTNIISHIRTVNHPKCPAVFKNWVNALDLSQCYLPSVVLFEIEKGILRKERTDPTQGAVLRHWFDNQIKPTFTDRIIALDEPVALQSAHFHVPNPASINDAFIGAMAKCHQMTLVTRNVQDFATFGITVFNPFA